MSLFRSAFRKLPKSQASIAVRGIRYNSSVKDIADQQHSGSRSAPKPTKSTGTSTQAPNDPPGNTPPAQEELPETQQQKAPEQEDGEAGSSNYMAHNEDTQGGEIKSSSPFRAAPIENKVG